MQKGHDIDFTKGSIVAGLVKFSVPLMIGNLLQQFYNIADTLIVGRFIGKEALQHGRQDKEAFFCGNFMSFVLIGGFAMVLNGAVYLGMDGILVLLQIPADVYALMRSYVMIIYGGIMATFLYNYFANCLRAVGNSIVPLVFLGVSALLNVAMDILLVAVFPFGIRGAAAATVFSQYVSGIGIWIYTWKKVPALRFAEGHKHFRKDILKSILSLSLLTSLQQSIMNFGILMVQGLVNSFGTAVMAAFSTFVAQNHGAGQKERIKEGGRKAVFAVLVFCMAVSLVVVVFAGKLMAVFTDDPEIIKIGISYLRMEGVFYCLIGFLFLFYGYFRAVEQPVVSVVLTITSLGTRVLLSYLLSAISPIGYRGIWASIPIGWAFADLWGLYFLKGVRKTDGTKHSFGHKID
ncbi:MAG: MATE family efflux transporter [Lachnospiraceae bacterium]|nr:MATE family efflux transporter [Lachnospiraceae bacterium]